MKKKFISGNCYLKSDKPTDMCKAIWSLFLYKETENIIKGRVKFLSIQYLFLDLEFDMIAFSRTVECSLKRYISQP